MSIPVVNSQKPGPIARGYALGSTYPDMNREVHYRESLYVGYRYYDAVGIEPAYPFGHGLSYTSFLYAGLEASYMAETIDGENPSPHSPYRSTSPIRARRQGARWRRSTLHLSRGLSQHHAPHKNLSLLPKYRLILVKLIPRVSHSIGLRFVIGTHNPIHGKYIPVCTKFAWAHRVGTFACAAIFKLARQHATTLRRGSQLIRQRQK